MVGVKCWITQVVQHFFCIFAGYSGYFPVKDREGQFMGVVDLIDWIDKIDEIDF